MEKHRMKKLPTNLQAILNRLQLQLDSMSPEEYKKELSLISQMDEGPTVEELINPSSRFAERDPASD